MLLELKMIKSLILFLIFTQINAQNSDMRNYNTIVKALLFYIISTKKYIN
jgi:hypothetical protein